MVLLSSSFVLLAVIASATAAPLSTGTVSNVGSPKQHTPHTDVLGRRAAQTTGDEIEPDMSAWTFVEEDLDNENEEPSIFRSRWARTIYRKARKGQAKDKRALLEIDIGGAHHPYTHVPAAPASSAAPTAPAKPPSPASEKPSTLASSSKPAAPVTESDSGLIFDPSKINANAAVKHDVNTSIKTKTNLKITSSKSKSKPKSSKSKSAASNHPVQVSAGATASITSPKVQVKAAPSVKPGSTSVTASEPVYATHKHNDGGLLSLDILKRAAAAIATAIVCRRRRAE